VSDLKSLLLHFDGTTQSLARLQWTRHLASVHEAQLTVLYAVTPATLRFPATYAMEAGFGPSLADFDQELQAQARQSFEDAPAHGAPTGRWVEGLGIAEHSTTQVAWYHDLMVLGQSSPPTHEAGGVDRDFVPNVVIDSGRPALVVPYIGAPPTWGQQVVVAWKPCRESARAVTASLPILRKAQGVTVVHFGDGATQGLMDYLAAHGVRAVLRRLPLPQEDVLGDLLLSQASDWSADMLVTGCFGHSRAREWILGGVTRTLLRSMTLPVLMAH